jgi:hypothetical protein
VTAGIRASMSVSVSLLISSLDRLCAPAGGPFIIFLGEGRIRESTPVSVSLLISRLDRSVHLQVALFSFLG